MSRDRTDDEGVLDELSAVARPTENTAEAINLRALRVEDWTKRIPARQTGYDLGFLEESDYKLWRSLERLRLATLAARDALQRRPSIVEHEPQEREARLTSELGREAQLPFSEFSRHVQYSHDVQRPVVVEEGGLAPVRASASMVHQGSPSVLDDEVAASASSDQTVGDSADTAAIGSMIPFGSQRTVGGRGAAASSGPAAPHSDLEGDQQ